MRPMVTHRSPCPRLLRFAPVRAALALVALLGAVACGDLPAADSQIETLSSRPDMVTGGDALVRIAVPAGVALKEVRVTLNGSDVSAAFQPAPGGSALLGLVTGLRVGMNTLALGGGLTGQLTLTNHPATGPLFAGAHETPFLCGTQEFTLVTGETLGAPLDENCSIARRVDYGYRSTEGGALKPLLDRSSYPADMARTTTSTGADVPYIVRIETGSANRGIYESAMLHDPISEPEPNPWVTPAGWNRRVIYTLGGGCPGGWYIQGSRTAGVTNDFYLHQGYAVVSNSLNVFGNNCSEILTAETAAMTKERFVEAYGPPLFVVATGSSGGSYQTYHAIDNYPGIFDGGIPGSTYPDVQFATTPWNSDARLFLTYFNEKTALPWTDAQKLASIGFTNLDFMGRIGKINGHSRRIRVGEACNLPEELIYHPVTNPTGARCDVFEHTASVYGRNPETKFVRRPIDNVGVQYGLKALNDGVISKEQFLDLNEKVGGFDLDGNVASERTVGDTIGMRRAYESGLLLNGGGGLAYTPIIEFRGYADDNPGGDDHPRFMSFSTKARLLKVNGHMDNFVMLTVDDDEYGRFSTNDPQVQEAWRQMDAWLTTLKADTSSDPQLDKVRRARPADLVDACWTRFPERRKIVEEQKDAGEPSQCQDLYPSGSFARGVAGSSIATDIIKCQLKPIDPTDYTGTFTAEETARLQRIFPEGVCDWSRPGVAQTKPLGPWYVVPVTPATM